MYQIGCYFYDQLKGKVEEKKPNDLGPKDQNTQKIARNLFETIKEGSIPTPINLIPNKQTIQNSPQPPLKIAPKTQKIVEEEKPDPIFHDVSSSFISQIDIPGLMKTLPPAYYCFQLWGAQRKEPYVLEDALKKIQKTFENEKGDFENALPVVMIILRSADTEDIEQTEYAPELLENLFKKGIHCIVAMNAYRFHGNQHNEAVEEIKSAYQAWKDSKGPIQRQPRIQKAQKNKTLTKRERVKPVFDRIGSQALRSLQPALESLVKSLPPAYYCFQIWGASRKSFGTLQEGLTKIQAAFQDDEGAFENALPVVIIVLRSANSEGEVEKVNYTPQELEDFYKKGIHCIVPFNAYGDKVYGGSGYDESVKQIEEICDKWEPS